MIEDEAALLRVMTYIEQNPVRAGCCDQPSDFKWCSAGQTKIRLKENKPTIVAAIGPFRAFQGRERAQAYVSWMDYQAALILKPELKKEPPPRIITNMCLQAQELEMWRLDFQKRGPCQWQKQGYGNNAFESTIQAAEEALILALAMQRYVATRQRTRSNQVGPHFIGHSGSWWYEETNRNARLGKEPQNE